MRLNASTRGAPRTSELAPGREHHQRASRVRVTTAPEAAARDDAAIQAGIESFALMLRAGTRAAEVILREFAHQLPRGVAVYAGVGNNGGDAYIVAAQLARAGVHVRLHATGAPRTDDAKRAAALAHAARTFAAPTGNEALIVDGVLGTGHIGALRGEVTVACDAMRAGRDRGSLVVALDLPSGLDATTGVTADGSLAADVTVSFGTIKRGVLLSRGHAGKVMLVDIGLAEHVHIPDGAWVLPDDDAIAHTLPSTAWDAHKGRRGHLVLCGGTIGMAGALFMATRAALHAGCGLVSGVIEGAGVSALQQAAPQAIAREWPTYIATGESLPWGTAVVIGPGLGRDVKSRATLHRALRENAMIPMLLDADALTLLARDRHQTVARDDAAVTLRARCGQSPQVVITPHLGEFAALIGGAIPTDWSERVAIVQDFAARARVTVLLKGTPTLIAAPDSEAVTVVARGTAMLATGGSGDMLAGIIGALLAQGVSAHDAAMLGATAHGVAAEIATATAQTIRGVTLEDLLLALPSAWRVMANPAHRDPAVIAELPAPLARG